MRKKKMRVEPTCPAAQPVGGSFEDGNLVVVCNVVAKDKRSTDLAAAERDNVVGALIRQQEDEASLKAFCCEKYAQCPVWQEGRKLSSLRAQRRAEKTEAIDRDIELEERYGISAT
jgi:hypothetical protein